MLDTNADDITIFESGTDHFIAIYDSTTGALFVPDEQLVLHLNNTSMHARDIRFVNYDVVLGITTGGVLTGVLGALLAVPVIAFANSFIRVLIADEPEERSEQLEDDDGPLIDAAADDDV